MPTMKDELNPTHEEQKAIVKKWELTTEIIEYLLERICFHVDQDQMKEVVQEYFDESEGEECPKDFEAIMAEFRTSVEPTRGTVTWM